jgi:predicted GNAT family N-acyltransferase
MPSLITKHVQSELELEHALSVRRQVFIEEQAVPESIERDGFDQWLPNRSDVLHVVGYLNGEPVAAGRVVLKMSGYDYPKIGRIAVLKSARGQGFGVQVMDCIHGLSAEQGVEVVTLSAQCHAVPFYRSLGYVPLGDIYLEADIEHQMMEYTLSS